MRHLQIAPILAVALASTGCFQMTTIVHLNGDGSGTIDHTLVISKQSLAQLRQFAMLAGGLQGSRGAPGSTGSQGSLDFMSEEQARRTAATLGSGVTYVSSEAVNTDTAEGRHATYAFVDINTVRINETPQPPGGLSIKTQSFSTENTITCAFARDPNGNAVLRIHLPELNLQGLLGNVNAADANFAQQLAAIRSMLKGATVTIGVEPAGTLVRATSGFVEGPRVTLLDVNVDQVLTNESAIARVQAAKSPEELKAILGDLPGLKIALDREVTIEFTPAK